MSTDTFLQIKKLLDDAGTEYKHITHDVVRTSQQAAGIRRTDLDDGAKALVLLVHEPREGSEAKDGEFVQFVLQASKRLDLKKVKNILGVKNASLASPQEVLEHTGCEIGSVPPFGTLFGIRLFVDEDLLKREQIVFSAGTHTDSIILTPQDYLELVDATIVEIKK